MNYKPTMLLDKSTLRGLNEEEINLLQNHYIIIVPQILVREILGELAKKDENSEKIKKSISILSRRLVHYETVFYPDALYIATYQLSTGINLPFSGLTISFDAKIIHTKDGKLGYFVDEPAELSILRRWQSGIFTDEEVDFSQSFKDIVRNFDLNNFKKDLEVLTEINIPDPSMKKIFSTLENIFTKIPGFSLLRKLFEILHVSSIEQGQILKRWNDGSYSSVRKFSPYAYYFFLIFTTFLYGIKSGLIPTSKKEKAHVDIEYFLYLPFTKAMSSDDNLFKKFFDSFSVKDQIFFNNASIREEIKLMEQDSIFVRSNFRSVEEIIQNNLGSKTYKLWFGEYFHPFNRENLADRLSEQQRKEIAERVLKPFNEGVEFYSKEPLNREYSKQYNNWDARQKFSELFKNARDIFQLDKGFEHVKKNITSDQVKRFFSLYADMWPPYIDTISFLQKCERRSRGLYLGDFEINDINEILYMTLLFDELVIKDPIPNPWCLKDGYNPISNPEKFKQETLKYLWLYSILEPFITERFVRIIPPPFFGGEAFKTASELSKRRVEFLRPTKEFKNIFEGEYKEKNRHEIELNFLALAEEEKIKYLKRSMPLITEEKIISLIKSYNKLRQIHPFALDQELINYEQFRINHSVTLEEAFFISSKMDCIPITYFKTKNIELNMAYGKDRGDFRNVIECFNKSTLNIVDNIPSHIIFAIRKHNFMKKHVELFQMISHKIKLRDFRELKSDRMKKNVSKALNGLEAAFVEITKNVLGVNSYPEKLQKYKLEVISSNKGAFIPDLDNLYRKVTESSKLAYPPISLSLIRQNGQ